jgi:hypothetical protein
MRTSLKVILAATAITALASPVMAHSKLHRHYTAPFFSNAYGRVVPADPGWAPYERFYGGNQFRGNNDCVHRQFPQCSDSAR